MTIILVSNDPQAAYACGCLADELQQLGASTVVVSPRRRQKTLYPLPETETCPQLALTPAELLCSPLLLQASALGVFLNGEELRHFVSTYRQICSLHKRRAAPVFSGPILPLGGDRLITDLLPRLCCDLICLHGERQMAEYRDLTRLAHQWPTKPPAAIPLGFWFMPESPPNGGLLGFNPPQPPHTLVVLVQRDLPNLAGAQLRMLRLLGQLASRSEDWRVLIQRDYPWEAGQSWPIKQTKAIKDLPANIAFGAAENLPHSLGLCSACFTLSSGWAFTAMAWGRPCGVMADHGIRADQGSALFFGSGVMLTLSDLPELSALLEAPALNTLWLDQLGWAVHDGPNRLLQELERLVQQ